MRVSLIDNFLFLVLGRGRKRQAVQGGTAEVRMVRAYPTGWYNRTCAVESDTTTIILTIPRGAS
jgi:hypothetical protein